MKEVALKLILGILAILGIILVSSLIVAVQISDAGHVPEHQAGKVVTCSEGLSWDANTEPDMASYLLSVGTTPGIYGADISVAHPSRPRVVVPCQTAGVVTDGQYYFVVEAMDLSGNISEPSDEFPFFLDKLPRRPIALDVN